MLGPMAVRAATEVAVMRGRVGRGEALTQKDVMAVMELVGDVAAEAARAYAALMAEVVKLRGEVAQVKAREGGLF